MKTIAKIGLAVGFVSTGLAQGTIEFRATLRPVPGFDWPYEPTTAQFSLSGHILNGTATYMIPANTTFIRIENASQTSLFTPSSNVDLAPQTAWLATWTDIQLTDNQMNELIEGSWRVNVGGGSYPNGALVGQLQIVPEPSTLGLIGLGLAGLAIWTLHARKPPTDRAIGKIDSETLNRKYS